MILYNKPKTATLFLLVLFVFTFLGKDLAFFSSMVCLVLLFFCRAEGALALLLGGHIFFLTIQKYLDISIPVLAFTSIGSLIFLLFFKETRLKLLSANLIKVFLVILFPILLLYLQSYENDLIVWDRFRNLSVSFICSTLVICCVYNSGVSLERLLYPSLLITIACYAYVNVIEFRLFERYGGVSILDIARNGAFAALLALFAVFEKKRSFFITIQSLIAVASGLSLSFLTLTRQGFFGFLSGFAIAAINYQRNKKAIRFFLFLCFTILIFLYSIEFGLLDSISTRVFTLSFDSRNDGYYIAWQLFLNNPIFGAGFGSFGQKINDQSLYPHNFILEILSEFGVVGLLIFFATCIFISLFINTKKYSKSIDNFWLSIAIFWIAISSVSYSLPHSFVSIPLVGVVLSRFRNNYKLHS